MTRSTQMIWLISRPLSLQSESHSQWEFTRRMVRHGIVHFHTHSMPVKSNGSRTVVHLTQWPSKEEHRFENRLVYVQNMRQRYLRSIRFWGGQWVQVWFWPGTNVMPFILAIDIRMWKLYPQICFNIVFKYEVRDHDGIRIRDVPAVDVPYTVNGLWCKPRHCYEYTTFVVYFVIASMPRHINSTISTTYLQTRKTHTALPPRSFTLHRVSKRRFRSKQSHI